MKCLVCPNCGEKLSRVDHVRLGASVYQDVSLNTGNTLNFSDELEISDPSEEFYRCLYCNYQTEHIEDFITTQ